MSTNGKSKNPVVQSTSLDIFGWSLVFTGNLTKWALLPMRGWICQLERRQVEVGAKKAQKIELRMSVGTTGTFTVQGTSMQLHKALVTAVHAEHLYPVQLVRICAFYTVYLFQYGKFCGTVKAEKEKFILNRKAISNLPGSKLESEKGQGKTP
ncbi:hypothetical protein STEG23_019062 [Scotinomys teguina]